MVGDPSGKSAERQLLSQEQIDLELDILRGRTLERAGTGWEAALVLVLACAPQARGDEAVAFSARVLPVLEKSCFVCHSPDDDQGGLSLRERLRSASASRV